MSSGNLIRSVLVGLSWIASVITSKRYTMRSRFAKAFGNNTPIVLKMMLCEDRYSLGRQMQSQHDNAITPYIAVPLSRRTRGSPEPSCSKPGFC